MASSDQLPSDRRLPFEVRSDGITGCSDGKYVGCYIIAAPGYFSDVPIAVYFVPLTAPGLNLSSYGDGTSCSKNRVICTDANNPSLPPSPPSPPLQPLSKTFPNVGIATSGTCESHGGQSITSADDCELVGMYDHPALPWEWPLQVPFAVVSDDDYPKHCYQNKDYYTQSKDQIRFNTVGGNCTAENVCVCTGLMSPPPHAPPSPSSPPYLPSPPSLPPPLPPPPLSPPPLSPSPPSLPPPPPSPPSLPPFAPLISSYVRVVKSGGTCEESSFTTITSPILCERVYEMAVKEELFLEGIWSKSLGGKFQLPQKNFQGCNRITSSRPRVVWWRSRSFVANDLTFHEVVAGALKEGCSEVRAVPHVATAPAPAPGPQLSLCLPISIPRAEPYLYTLHRPCTCTCEHDRSYTGAFVLA